MEKTIEICGREMKMRASALLPRLYRGYFGRDMICDMRKLQKAYVASEKSIETDGKTDEEIDAEKKDAQLSVTDLTIFENVAWLMLKHGGEKVFDSPDTWLDSIDGVFSVYEILPQILEMWNINNTTTSKPKKK
ncbi:hypothetical protein [Oscillibacter sp.]|uniref:hypothetical protein n=1 Tax=Oscillibacter sp. TaxID=1945593 RepID=UPI00289EAB0B|nr:hypothetical protein [Oscillibacter sp.]